MTAPEPGQTAIVAMLKALDAKATKGPWEFDPENVGKSFDDGFGITASVGPPFEVCHVTCSNRFAREHGADTAAANSALLVALRNALPALAAYCEAAEALHHYVTHADQYAYHVEAFELARTALAAALAKEA